MAARGVLVAGAGAVGSVFGALLSRAGMPVTLLGREAHVRAIAARGIALDGLFGAHRVPVAAAVSDVARLAAERVVLLGER